jgi:iron(III) transport system permease protein
MRLRQIRLHAVLNTGVVAAHAAVLLACAAVPCYAAGKAVWALARAPDETGLAHLVDVSRWLTLLGNTSLVAALAGATAIALGAAIAVLLCRTNLPGRMTFLGAILLLACIPVYVSMCFVVAAVPLWSYNQSRLVCGLLQGLVLTPLAVLLLGLAFRSADAELEDQARLDAGSLTVLLRVTLPGAAWGFAAVAMIVVVVSVTDFTIADTLNVRTFPEETYAQYALMRSPAGPVITGLPGMIVFSILLIVVRLRLRWFGEHSVAEAGRPPRMLRLGRLGGWVMTAACLAIGLLVLGPPAKALVERIGSVAQFQSSFWNMHEELLDSSVSSLIGAGLVVLFSAGLAWAAMRTRRLSWLVLIPLVLLLATPAPVIGIGLIQLLNRDGWPGLIYDSPAVIVIGYVVRFLPFGVLLLLPAARRVSRETELAARVDGCDWLGVQRHVYWPACSLDVLIAWLVVTILCFGEVACTVLLDPPGYPTASVRAFTLIHFGIYTDLAVLALAAAACVLLPWLLLAWLLWVRMSRRTRP